MTLAKFPTTSAGYNDWWSSTIDAIVGCSTDTKKAYAWAMEVEDDGVTYVSLSDPGRRFETMDAKLKTALNKVNRTHEELGLEISELSEETKKVYRRPLTGREILLKVRRFFDIRPDSRRLLEVADLEKLAWFGDRKMVEFLAAWKRMLRLMREVPSEESKREMFHRKVRVSHILKDDLAHYNRHRPRAGEDHTHRDHSYAFLIDAIERRIEMDREDKNHNDSVASCVRPGVPATPAREKEPAVQEESKKAKKKKKVDGEVVPALAAPKGKGSGKGKGKGKDKGRSQSAGTRKQDEKEKSGLPCYFWNDTGGKCPRPIVGTNIGT
jgi:hypothetical protein